jgi:uncharacterized membrane protein
MSRVSTRAGAGLWVLLAFLSVGVAVFSYRFLLPHPPVASPDILGNLMARPWLPVHAGLAATALIVGPFQFLTRLRARAPGFHRNLGKIYVAACLIGAPAGLILATHSTAGPIAQWGFGTLAVLWFGATAYAFWLATQGRIAEHRRWMIRSFAMTFAPLPADSADGPAHELHGRLPGDLVGELDLQPRGGRSLPELAGDPAAIQPAC